jgi:dihydrodipicolinate synthase/N-acetylneuraminate lyase
MLHRLQGVLPIVHTPFAENGDLDGASLQREIDWIFTAGADGLGTGMVSELLRLTIDERLRLTEQIHRR